MTVHLFGATSSPGCANFALKTTANQYESVCGKEAADFVRKDFYVDDGLKSVTTVEQSKSLIGNTNYCAKREASTYTNSPQTTAKFSILSLLKTEPLTRGIPVS